MTSESKHLEACGSDEPLLASSSTSDAPPSHSGHQTSTHQHRANPSCSNGCCNICEKIVMPPACNICQSGGGRSAHLNSLQRKSSTTADGSLAENNTSVVAGFQDVPYRPIEEFNSPVRSAQSVSRSVTSTPIAPPGCRRSLSAQLVQSPGGHSVRTVCSETSIMCRICHDGESHEDLISPCKCAGTMGMMHRTCIEQWLGSSNTSQCEICQFKYVTRKYPRPFMDWLRTPSRASDKRNLVGDAICFMLLTPLAVVSAWLCITGARNFSQYADGSGHWETIGLITLSVFLVIIYLVWCVIAFRYHCRVYIEWRSSNQVIKVMDMTHDAADHSHHSTVCTHSPASCTSPTNRLSRHGQPEQVSSLPLMVTSDTGSSSVTMATSMARAADIMRNIPTASLSDTFLVFALPNHGNVQRQQLKETYV